MDKNREIIKERNAIDIQEGEKKGLTKAFLDRLLLTDVRIDGMIEAIETVKSFRDPIGEIVEGFPHKKGMEIKPNEMWMDCGGNVGAFTLLACSKGAKVTVYEPDPYNCEMIKKNLELNGFEAEIKQAALVHNDTKEFESDTS